MTALDLKRDPANNQFVGPDNCHYANAHQAMHYGLLRLCGCGSPEDAYNFCQTALTFFDRRGAKEWVNAENALERHIANDPATAAHVIAHLLTHLKLLEHGSTVGGSWLTTTGEAVVDTGPMTETLMEQEWAD